MPFVHALLSSKESSQYAAVLRSVVRGAERFSISTLWPQRIMTDFEKSITNACTEIFPKSTLAGCFFHLGVSLDKDAKIGLREVQ